MAVTICCWLTGLMNMKTLNTVTFFSDLDSPTLTNTANDPIPYNPAFSYQYGWDSGLVDYAISKDGTSILLIFCVLESVPTCYLDWQL